MATRSRIAIENEDGSVTSIYCHWDGYPEHVGRILQEYYTDREKVKKLIALGSLSSLFPELEAPTDAVHSFDKPLDGITIAYHRDRGEELHQQIHKSKENFFGGEIEEYGYLFTKEGVWEAKSEYGSWRGIKNLEDILKVMS